MKLDSSSPIPLYQQLQEILRMEISGRVRKAGSKLPSEHELCRQYGITRPTVRQALEGLVREGLVRKHRGRGAFVTEPPMPVGLFALTGQGEAFAENKISVETQILRLAHVPSCLLSEGQDPPEGWVALERVRRINNVPTFYEYTWLPAGLVPALEQIDLRDRSLFSVMTERYNLRVGGGRQRFSAVAAPVQVAAALGLKAGVPLLRMVRLERLCAKLGIPGSTGSQRTLGMFHTDLYVAPGPFILEENIPPPPSIIPAAGSMPEVRAVQTPKLED